MIHAWIASRVEDAVRDTPVILRWLEQCDQQVIDTFRLTRRVLFTWQLPALSATALTAYLIKAFHGLPTGHPIQTTLLIPSLAVVAWPSPMARLASVALHPSPGNRRPPSPVRSEAATAGWRAVHTGGDLDRWHHQAGSGLSLRPVPAVARAAVRLDPLGIGSS